MKKGLFAAMLVLAGCAHPPPPTQHTHSSAALKSSERPNVLLIVLDDLGFSDIGAFGGEIATPNLDRLAMQGVRFTDFHAAPTCSPTRAMLLTGNDNHLVGLGTMGEMLAPDALRRPGYEGYLNRRSLTMAEIFRSAGYFTAMVGKWHLGAKPDQTPDARGFDRSYALMDGAAGHFGELAGNGYRQDGAVVQYPNGRYAGDVFTDHLLEYLAEAQDRQQPFFAYMALTDPHWPLQAPADAIAKYRGRYDAGPEVLREQRLQRLRELKLIAADQPPHEMVAAQEWATLSSAQRLSSARAMEIYAAMVTRADDNVGRVLAQLQRSGQLNNTLIVFMSDNGPDGTDAPMAKRLLLFSNPHAPPTDDSLANSGTANSFVAYGSEWAQASAAPFNRFKGYTTEGGIRVPLFVSGPGIKSGAISPTFLHVTDILPTLMDLANIRLPMREGLLPPAGRSFATLLQGETQDIHRDNAVGWELFAGRAIRLNQWKAVMLTPATPILPLGDVTPRWALYDLNRDQGETNDVGSQYPEQLERMIKAWDEYATTNGVIDLVAAGATGSADGDAHGPHQ